MIEKYIITLLEEKGSCALPGLGTFRLEQQSAVIDAEEALLLPPSEKVTFEGAVNHTEKDALRNLIFEGGEMFASQIDVEIERFVANIFETLDSQGSYRLPTLGTFLKSDDEISFESAQTTALSAENFGLPKIQVPDLEDDTDTPSAEAEADKKSSVRNSNNAAIPWLLSAPLILLALVFAYFFFNPKVYDQLENFFSGDNSPSPLVQTENPSPEISPTQTPADTNLTTEPPPPSTNAPSQETTEKTPSQSDIVAAPTKRFYLIAGSFKTAESARKALKEAKEKGYENAKILTADNKYRLSIGDYTHRKDATQAAVSEADKTYTGSWILEY